MGTHTKKVQVTIFYINKYKLVVLVFEVKSQALWFRKSCHTFTHLHPTSCTQAIFPISLNYTCNYSTGTCTYLFSPRLWKDTCVQQ